MNKGLIIIAAFLLFGCGPKKEHSQKTRKQVDTVGFAQYNWQMDSILLRTHAANADLENCRVAISPHDDYAYVGDLYPKVLNKINAQRLILFGVAHKARNFQLENKLVFGPFDAWEAPYGMVPVSELRNLLVDALPDSLCLVHEEMQSTEHSLEALIPFLQANNDKLEIVPILVPYMSFEKMNQIAGQFARTLKNIMLENNWHWGNDIAILITTDAVHYGDQDWGGSNYARFGTDSTGTEKAYQYEQEIIHQCLIGELNPEKIRKFIHYTVKEENYKEYKWTWCGRYAVPFGLLTSLYLNRQLEGKPLHGEFIGYSSSIDHPAIRVGDLNMGTTAPANRHHWVGYPAISYQ